MKKLFCPYLLYVNRTVINTLDNKKKTTENKKSKSRCFDNSLHYLCCNKCNVYIYCSIKSEITTKLNLEAVAMGDSSNCLFSDPKTNSLNTYIKTTKLFDEKDRYDVFIQVLRQWKPTGLLLYLVMQEGQYYANSRAYVPSQRHLWIQIAFNCIWKP